MKTFVTKYWPEIIGAIGLAILIIWACGCSSQETRVSAANAKEASARVAALAVELHDIELNALGRSLVRDLDDIVIHLGPTKPTVTIADWERDYNAAEKGAADQHNKTTAENESNAAQKDVANSALDYGLGLLGPAGGIGLALVAWLRKRKWQAVAHNAIAFGRQVTAVAEAYRPDVVEEVKGQFKKVQDNLGLTKLVVPILDAIKAQEPVVATDLIPKA